MLRNHMGKNHIFNGMIRLFCFTCHSLPQLLSPHLSTEMLKFGNDLINVSHSASVVGVPCHGDRVIITVLVSWGNKIFFLDFGDCLSLIVLVICTF